MMEVESCFHWKRMKSLLIYSGLADKLFAVIQRETGQMLQKLDISFVIYVMALNYDGICVLCSGHNNWKNVPMQEFNASDL
eukprot:TRINITY_DN3211_c1_g4_i1.p1 TRINITY_DN3211_c1_g4~~TRINITY_DN3211_c1_g4_i1.p1  ORF type:complete len:81 (-),score=10.58 TRINITY_DN3211_c1_g4_i1:387-629(-)